MGPFHTVKSNSTLNEISQIQKDKDHEFSLHMWNLGFVYVYKTRSRKGTMRKMEVQREGKRNKRADCDVCVLRAKWESVGRKRTNEREGRGMKKAVVGQIRAKFSNLSV